MPAPPSTLKTSWPAAPVATSACAPWPATCTRASSVPSATGSILLYAGDDVVLDDFVTVQAALGVELNAGFNDSDNHGDLNIAGTASIIAGTDLGIGVVGDLTVGSITANGTVSLRSL